MKTRTQIPTEKVSITVPQLLVLDAIESWPNGHGISFVKLREQLELTDGNLFSHIRRLHQFGFVTKRKTFEDEKPITFYHPTLAGRTYLGFIRAMVSTDSSEPKK